MTMQYWMHWFWITFIIILLSSQASKSFPSVNTMNTTLMPSLLNTTSIINFKITTLKDVRIPKAIDITNNQQQTKYSTKTTYENINDDENKINRNDNAKFKLTIENKTLNNVNNANNGNSTNDTNCTNCITQSLDNNTEIFLNTTETMLTLANDQQRKQLIIEDVDITPTNENTVHEILDVTANIAADESRPSLSVATITGTTFGVLVFVIFVAVISFVLYRRRYLNKPHSLNDKCSNLDSSGYIDDNTIRENSEEMYSLDNDSFLNSLEAMTIQNYWTDNVKHTKL